MLSNDNGNDIGTAYMEGTEEVKMTPIINLAVTPAASPKPLA